jgi:hypothetical protein
MIKIVNAALALIFILNACSAQPEAITPEKMAEVQELADVACQSKSAQDGGAWDDHNPSRRWTRFDKRIKALGFERMSVASDGPVSNEGICLGGGGDSCRPERIIWISRSFGACSESEEKKKLAVFETCMKGQAARGEPNDELACQ